MVERIIGKADGFEIVFTLQEGLWVTTVPRKIDSGNYSVEVWAYDTAGNISYLATVLCTVDPSGISIYPESQKQELLLKEEKYWLQAVRPQRCGRRR